MERKIFYFQVVSSSLQHRPSGIETIACLFYDESGITRTSFSRRLEMKMGMMRGKKENERGVNGYDGSPGKIFVID